MYNFAKSQYVRLVAVKRRMQPGCGEDGDSAYPFEGTGLQHTGYGILVGIHLDG